LPLRAYEGPDVTELRKYRAHATGFYHISAMTLTYRDTGKKQWVPNDDRMWFQFWKPKVREIPIFERVEEHTSNATVFLNEGDEVQSNFLQRIEGPQ
jgi:hypothetical protein